MIVDMKVQKIQRWKESNTDVTLMHFDTTDFNHFCLYLYEFLSKVKITTQYIYFEYCCLFNLYATQYFDLVT